MQVTLSDDLKLPERAAAAGFSDVAEYLADLIERDFAAELPPIVEPGTERPLSDDELRAALTAGDASIAAGRVGPLDTDAIRREIEAKYPGQTSATP